MTTGGRINSDSGGAHEDATPLTLIARRTIAASAERLFAAWTDPAQLMAWWGPRADVACPDAQVDLRVGGSYRIGNRFADGSTVWIAGQYEVIEPPRKLVFSWYIDTDSPTVERVTVRLEPRGGSTEVIIIHERIVNAQARDRHGQGWAGCLDGLVQYLKGP